MNRQEFFNAGTLTPYAPSMPNYWAYGAAPNASIPLGQAWLLFKVDRMEKGSASATMNYYESFYRKLLAHFNNMTNGRGEDAPVDWLAQKGSQLLFTTSLGDINPRSIASYLRAYKAFGRFCEDQGFISGFKCTIKRTETPIKETYTDREIAALEVKPKITDFVAFRNYTMIELLLATAVRTNTIINIRVGDVNLEERYISFNTTKANRVARVPLVEKAVAVLAQYMYKWRYKAKPSDYLFYGEGGKPLTRHGFYYAISSYNKSRGVTKTSPHLFRHTFIKNWLVNGGDPYSLKLITTHADLSIIEHYANLYAHDVRAKAEQFATINHPNRRR